MVQDIIIPNLGLTMTEATIAKWVKNEGDFVEAGGVVMAIETDKVTFEVEAPQPGFLHIICEAGGVYPVTAVVGWVAESKEEYKARLDGEQREYNAVPASLAEKKEEAAPASQPEGPRGKGREKRIKSSPSARRLAREKGIDLALIEGTGPDSRIVKEDVLRAADEKEKTTSVVALGQKKVRSSPMARKVAEDKGIDLSIVEGSGPGGRIVKEDVLRAIEEKDKSRVVSAKQDPGDLKRVKEVVPITGMRKVIFDHMHRSLQEAAQITLTMEVNAGELVRCRKVLLERLKERDIRISYNAILIRILAHALEEHPRLNSSVVGDEILLWKSVNIGVAMDVEKGLVVPVIQDVNRKDIIAIQAEMDVFVEKARSKRIMPDDLQGGTFTLTALGFLDIEAFTPILNFPESGILGVGKIVKKPVVENDEIRVGERIMLSLTFDHRIIDGADGARFLKRVKAYIEEPYFLLAGSNR